MVKLNITDIDLNFSPHPLTGDISMKSGSAAIKQSLKNLMLFSSLEKPFNSEINLNLREYLFLNFNEIYEDELKNQIKTVIETYETRVVINNISVLFQTENNNMSITIDFTIIGDKPTTETLDIIVERLR